jgi:hypothetical protein
LGLQEVLLLTPTTREEPVDLDKFKARMEKYPNGTTMPNLATQVQQMLPTPTATDFKGAYPPTSIDNHPARKNLLRNVYTTEPGHEYNSKTSQLSPLFVEEMMGFPKGWTASPFQSGAESQ